jgi:hypothetical protein
MHMQPMYVYAEKEDSFICWDSSIYMYSEGIYNKIDASCLKDYVSLKDKTR